MKTQIPWSPKVQVHTNPAQQLKGYKPLKDNAGYHYEENGKEMAVVGAMPFEQTFFSEKFGLLNISKAIAACAREKRKPLQVAIDDGLKHHVSLVQIDHDAVDNMRTKRRNEAILMVVASDGVNVIDGHHRLARRIQDGCAFVWAHLLEPHALAMMQVQIMEKKGEHDWEQVGGVSPLEVLKEIRAAQAAVQATDAHLAAQIASGS